MYYHLLYVTASLRVGGEPVTYGDHVLVVGDAAGKHSIFPHFVLIGASQIKSYISMTAFSMCVCSRGSTHNLLTSRMSLP